MFMFRTPICNLYTCTVDICWHPCKEEQFEVSFVQIRPNLIFDCACKVSTLNVLHDNLLTKTLDRKLFNETTLYFDPCNRTI